MENMQVLFWLQYVMINCHWKSETNFYYDWQLLQTQDFVYYILLTNRVRGAVPQVTDQDFSSSIYGPSAKRAGHKSKGKKRRSVTYSTDRENEVSKIFYYISGVCLRGSGTISYSRGTASNF